MAGVLSSLWDGAFSDFGPQIITKLQRNLKNGQLIFKYIALKQVKFGEILEPLKSDIC